MSTTNQLKRSVDLLKKEVPLLFFLSMTTVLPSITLGDPKMLCVSVSMHWSLLHTPAKEVVTTNRRLVNMARRLYQK